MTFLGWPARSRKLVQPGRSDRCRPELEPLEARWAPAQFTNPTPITIPGTGTNGPAAPYPSVIAVSGLAGTVSKVTVRLHGFSHTFPDDVDVLLVAPNGTNAIILSDVGGDTNAVNLTLTLDDAAAAPLPDAGPLTSGTFRPTDIGTSPDPFPVPAPAPSGGRALATFNGLNPNGTWRLFVVDDGGSDSGSIAGGWTLDIRVRSFTTTAVSAAPNPTLFGQAVTLTATVTGPGDPTGTVTFRDGGDVLGAAPLVGGRAVLTVSGPGPGVHAITAAYGGDGNFHGSTSALVLAVHEQITAVPFRKNGVARVRVRGATTGMVRGVLRPFPGFSGRLAVQLVDVNGDGVLDVVVQAVVNGKRRKKVYDAVALTPLPSNLA